MSNILTLANLIISNTDLQVQMRGLLNAKIGRQSYEAGAGSSVTIQQMHGYLLEAVQEIFHEIYPSSPVPSQEEINAYLGGLYATNGMEDFPDYVTATMWVLSQPISEGW